MKTSELIGPALDWAVAKCEGVKVEIGSSSKIYHWLKGYPDEWEPSKNWAQGGPIIEREEIDLNCYESPKICCGWWSAEITGTEARAKATTPLIAAMRCYVASRLGNEVAIPEELK